MTYKTHVAGGLCAACLACTFAKLEMPLAVIAISGLCAQLPDLDIAGSKINNQFGLAAKVIAKLFSHRGFVHTPLLFFALTTLLYRVPFAPLYQGFFLGTFSHLLLDTFNRKGIMWLYPLSKKHFYISRIKSRSFGETVFLYAMVLVTVACVALKVVWMGKTRWMV